MAGSTSQPRERLSSRTTALCLCVAAACATACAGERDAGTGLKGEYFADIELRALRLTRVDPTIDFDWNEKAPDKTVPREDFSVRWTGSVTPRFSETYTFYTMTDDGVALWVSDELLVDHWAPQAAAEWNSTITLEAGKKYSIKMEYFQGKSNAVARLLWSSKRQAKEIIPRSQLSPAPAGPAPGRVTLTTPIPVLTMPAELPVLEKKEDWARTLAATEGQGLPQAWLLLGPRPDMQFRLFDRPRGIEPENTDDWTLTPRDDAGRPLAAMLWNRRAEDENAPGYVDLAVVLQRDSDALAFARSDVDWPVAGSALLWLTVDGRAAVYLNGERVWVDAQPRPGRVALPLRMKEGRNVLKMKIGQHNGAFGFYARLERNDPAYRIALLERLLELHPGEAAGPRGEEAHMEIARRYEELGQIREASTAYQKALLAHPDSDEVRIAVGATTSRLERQWSTGPDAAWKATRQQYDSALNLGNASAADDALRDFIARYPLQEQTATALALRGALREDFGLGADSVPFFERACAAAGTGGGATSATPPAINEFALGAARQGLFFAQSMRPPRSLFDTAHEVQATLEGARRQLASGSTDDIERAMRNLGAVLRASNGSLVSVSDARFFRRHVGAHEYVRAVLAGLNPAALTAYRKAVALASEERLRRACAQGEVLALEAVAAQYPYTPAAAQALNRAGNLEWDRGAWPEAAAYFARLLRMRGDVPGDVPSVPGALVAAKLAQAAARSGDAAAAREAAARLARDFGNEQLSVRGSTLTAGEFARKLLESGGTAAADDAPRAAGGIAQPGGVVWTRIVPFSPSMATARAAVGRMGAPLFSVLQPRPAVADGQVFVSTLESLQALDLVSGRKLWAQAWDSAGSPTPGRFAGVPASRPSVYDGRVYMRVLEGKQSALRCYLAGDGTLYWSTPGNPALRKLLWLSDPVAAYGLVIAPYLERIDQVMNTHGLAALDAVTGEVRWMHVLATGEIGVRVGEERMATALQVGAPTVSEGIVYAPTGLSSLAAVNVFTGAVVWLSGYPCAQIGDLTRGNSGLNDNAQFRTQKLFTRGAVSPVVAGDVVVLAPKEAPSLIGFDRQSGEIRWRHALNDCRFLAGPCDGNILAVDDTVKSVRAATGAVTWESAVRGGLHGQPAYAAGMLYVPAKGELQVMDARTGVVRTATPWDSRLGPMGNLVVTDERLLGVNDSAIAAFGRKGSPAAELPLEEAKALAAKEEFPAAAEKYAKAAGDPDSVLEALNGRVRALQALNRKDEALADIERFLAGAPELLQSRNGNWKIAKRVLSDALRARLGQPAAKGSAAPAAVPRGLEGTLSYAWHFHVDEPHLTSSPTAPPDCVWVYGSRTLYWLRLGERPEVLWQTYIGSDSAWISIGPTALAVGSRFQVEMLDRATGEVMWSLPLSRLQTKARADVNLDPFQGAALDENVVAVLARDAIVCFDLRTGQEHWWNKKDERRMLHYAVVDGKLAEVCGHGFQPTVYSTYDVQTGKVLTTTTLHQGTDWTWSAAPADGRHMVFRPEAHRITCIDMATGETDWDAKVPNLDFKWTMKNLSWDGEFPTYHGENRDRPDRAWMVYELNARTGDVMRAYAAGHETLGDSLLYSGEAGWGKLGIQRADLQRPAEDVTVWPQKPVWSHVFSRVQGEGCRLLKARLSSDSTRLYVLYTREAAGFHFVLRTFAWADGQLLDEEILPGAPFAYEEWDKPYRGSAEARGNLLLYTAADGLYAYTARGVDRPATAAKLRETLAAGPPVAQQTGTPVAQQAEARRDLRRALAGTDPVTLHALLAPKEVRADADLSEWDIGAEQGMAVAQPLRLAGAESYVPLADGAAWGGAEDLAARVHAAWNQAGVFIAVEVWDDRFAAPLSPTALTTGDSIRIAVNATPDHRWGYDPHETVVCGLGLVDGQPVLNLESAAPEDPQARPTGGVSRRPDGKGLLYEVALPWALLRHDPAQRPGERKELRVGLAVYDNDGSGTKGALEWGAGLTTSPVVPQWFGVLSLLDISRERIERYKKVIATIPDTPEAMQYLRTILASKRGPRAVQEQTAELEAFVKAHPDSRNTYRALIFLRSVYKDQGDGDPTAKAVAVAKAARCPAAIAARLAGQADLAEKGSGLEGEYYGTRDFINLKITRVDPTIDFSWNNKQPHPSVGADSFSVRWTGQVKPLYSETYTFHTISDDGVRLWVDDKLIVDNWTDHSAIENSGAIALIGGTRYDIKLDYFQGWGLAVMALGWSSQSQKKEVIPQECLFPPTPDPSAAVPGGPAKPAPLDPAKLQAGYREASRLLPDAPDGWTLLQLALNGFPPDAWPQRIQECEAYLKEFPETANSAAMLQALQGFYAKAGRNAAKECEDLMQACKLPRDARRAFHTQAVPAWTTWHVLGPVQASGEGRGMEQAMEPERGVDLAWKGRGPLEIPLVWRKVARQKEDTDQSGVVDLHRALVDTLDAQKKAEIERESYFAYAWRKINVPSQRRATLFFGVNDTISIWLNSKRVVTQSAPGANKDAQAVEANLREGDNEILIKAGVPTGRLHFCFRIADQNGKPFDDLPKN